jgi:hypothetical protein
MKYGKYFVGVFGVLFVALEGCDKQKEEAPLLPEESPRSVVMLEDVAQLLSTLPLGVEQMMEVQDATGASAGNGYDEEYRMRDLFVSPGRGVGEASETKAQKYGRPLRDLLREALATKASGTGIGASDGWLDSLALSDVQIYWPGASAWDGNQLPIITYDPGDGASQNEGYELLPDGSTRKVMVDEPMAAERPVWVVNRNSDADYKSLELLRREDPSWGQGGGGLIVKGEEEELRTLVLRSFKALRQYDSWFCGASEFWIKIGAVEDFTAATEPELRLYQPSITDFMLVVRRNQVGLELPVQAILVSEWTQQLSSAAYMMLEDDGGSQTTWKCAAVVKYNSKSYGFELEIPLNSRDDIVWRGALTHAFIEKNSGQPIRFGDVELVLELI